MLKNFKITKLANGKDLPLPKYKTSGSAGMDLYAAIESKIILKAGQFELIPSGIAIELANLYEAQIRPRSGLAAKSNITVLNTPGTIDSDYRGEIKIILFNHSKENFLVKNGDRIAQMILMPVLKIEFDEVNELPDTIRGSGGFGSTGK